LKNSFSISPNTASRATAIRRKFATMFNACLGSVCFAFPPRPRMSMLACHSLRFPRTFCGQKFATAKPTTDQHWNWGCGAWGTEVIHSASTCVKTSKLSFWGSCELLSAICLIVCCLCCPFLFFAFVSIVVDDDIVVVAPVHTGFSKHPAHVFF
jgi:hypothetical protein